MPVNPHRGLVDPINAMRAAVAYAQSRFTGPAATVKEKNYIVPFVLGCGDVIELEVLGMQLRGSVTDFNLDCL